MKQVVQSLQLALEKEKSKVKDLKEQVGASNRVNLLLCNQCSFIITCKSFASQINPECNLNILEKYLRKLKVDHSLN